jgi:hypothetical protein
MRALLTYAILVGDSPPRLSEPDRIEAMVDLFIKSNLLAQYPSPR